MSNNILIIAECCQNHNGAREVLKKMIHAAAENGADYVKIQSLLYEELYQGLELNELHYEAARLQARLIETYVKTQKNKLALALETSDESDTRVMLEQAKQYG